jgi:hypothetical protein
VRYAGMSVVTPRGHYAQTKASLAVAVSNAEKPERNKFFR